jgi:hypothetical protein
VRLYLPVAQSVVAFVHEYLMHPLLLLYPEVFFSVLLSSEAGTVSHIEFTLAT